MHQQTGFSRRCGILLHPTSLPGPEGIGTLGEEAFRFADFLAETGQKLWQTLPLNPPGLGNSPYSSHSAFAGSTLLISADSLVKSGLLKADDIDHRPSLADSHVDYDEAASFKKRVLKKAWSRFRTRSAPSGKKAFKGFCDTHAHWLDDYALYIAIKEHFHETAWFEWPLDIAAREPSATRKLAKKLSGRIEEVKFHQFLFFEQWAKLKEYANGKGIEIIGDIPIFVNHDSADVWTYPQFFLMDKDGQLTEQSGVPPDPRTGVSQIWGSPLYNWESMLETEFEWWVRRFEVAFMLVDIARIDHFCGFAKCWHIPFGAETSRKGRWVESPGFELFQAVDKELGRDQFIAEDLGASSITALLEYTGFPGMRVLHFAFDNGPENLNLPHNYDKHAVVYTGTHDNDTSIGWFRGQPPQTRERILHYLGSDGRQIQWDLVRAALASIANTAIVPLQDILGLDSGARMNIPGTHCGQWEWRYQPGMLTKEITSRLSELSSLYGR